MAPAHIDDVDKDLAARILRKLEQLKSVDDADLIVPVQQMAVPGLYGGLVAVDQNTRGVEEMSVAESARHRDRGNRTDGLYRIDNRRVRDPGSVSHRTVQTAAKEVGAG